MRCSPGRTLIAVIMVAMAPQVRAQDATADPAPAPALIAELAACRPLTDDAQRLSCLDRAAAALVDAQAANQVVLVDRAAVRDAKRAVFGFSLPEIRLFRDDGEDEAEDVRSLSGTLAQVRPFSRGLHLFVLDDGSQWQTTEAGTNFFPRAGDPFTITAGALGSYNARVDGGRSISVKRVN